MNAMLQDLRKENQTLKQANYDLELKSKGSNFTDDKVTIVSCRSKYSTMRSTD